MHKRNKLLHTCSKNPPLITKGITDTGVKRRRNWFCSVWRNLLTSDDLMSKCLGKVLLFFGKRQTTWQKKRPLCIYYLMIAHRLQCTGGRSGHLSPFWHWKSGILQSSRLENCWSVDKNCTFIFCHFVRWSAHMDLREWKEKGNAKDDGMLVSLHLCPPNQTSLLICYPRQLHLWHGFIKYFLLHLW